MFYVIIFTILFILIYLIAWAIFAYFIPVLVINKYYDLKLNKSWFVKYCLYFWLAPLALIFSKNFYLELWNKSQKLKNKFIFVLFYIFIVIIWSIISWIITNSIRHYYIPFQISWESMSPNFYNKEFIIIKKQTSINRWDVVILNTNIEDKKYFIKRVIWIWWDSIKISAWKVYLKKSWENTYNLLQEPYLSWNSINNTSLDSLENVFNIPEWKYFVMWDNRNYSTDSRNCFWDCDSYSNYIEKKDILWKAYIDLWYFDLKTWELTKPRFFEINKD